MPLLTLSQTLRDIRERGLENVFQRFYAFYQVETTTAADPQQMGRSKIKIKSLGYNEEFDFADTFSPFASDDAGFFFPPYEEDKEVFVSFDHGDISSPMVMGGYWKTRGQKRPADSGVPAEFVKVDGSAPTVRGIKVRVGSGIAFDETTDQVKVEVWTGASRGIGSVATRHHQVVLNDTTDDENILIKSKDGHQTTWRDKVGEVWVETKTAGGHRLLMDDTGKKILIESAGKHTITIDDNANTIEAATQSGSKVTINGAVNSITLETVGKHKVVVSDVEGITATTPLLRTVTISDKEQTIRAFSPLPPQTIELSALTGTTISDSSPLGVKILANSGPLAATGQGTTITAAGGAPAVTTNAGVSTGNFTGLVTSNILGGEIKTITGSWTLGGAFIASINALFIFLGTGTQLRLVNENFLTTAYAVHLHPVLTGITGPPVFGLGVPGTHTTIQTFAS